jgi:hypothetical protein
VRGRADHQRHPDYQTPPPRLLQSDFFNGIRRYQTFTRGNSNVKFGSVPSLIGDRPR